MERKRQNHTTWWDFLQFGTFVKINVIRGDENRRKGPETKAKQNAERGYLVPRHLRGVVSALRPISGGFWRQSSPSSTGYSPTLACPSCGRSFLNWKSSDWKENHFWVNFYKFKVRLRIYLKLSMQYRSKLNVLSAFENNLGGTRKSKIGTLKS